MERATPAGRDLGDVRFSARNDATKQVTFASTPRLRRAIRARAVIDVELRGFR